MDKNKLNPYFYNLKVDYIYHLGINTNMDLQKTFGNIQYVIFTTSNSAAQEIANQFARNIYNIPDENFSYKPIYKTERFHMYKVGITLIISIGVGMQSLLIGLNEITRLFAHLGKYDVIYLKVATSGGIGIANGTAVISHKIFNGKFENHYESIECGNTYYYPTYFNNEIADELFKFSLENGYDNVCQGDNLSTNNFTDEQARMNGAIVPEYTQEEALAYLTQAYQIGIRSIDMESLAFAGFCNQLDIQGCVVNISIVNRLVTEDITIPIELQLKMISSVAQILIHYIQAKKTDSTITKVS